MDLSEARPGPDVADRLLQTVFENVKQDVLSVEDDMLSFRKLACDASYV